MSDGSDWVATIAADTIDPDYPSMATLGDVEVALCRVDGEVFAIGNICTHAYARLSDGFVEGCEVFCPLHQGSFDVRTGEAIASPCYEPVASYATKVEGGVVYVARQPRA